MQPNSEKAAEDFLGFLKVLPDPGRLPSSLEGIPPKDRLAVHNDQMLVGLVASHDGADHGLDRPRATPWGAGQSERDVVRSLHFFSQTRAARSAPR